MRTTAARAARDLLVGVLALALLGASALLPATPADAQTGATTDVTYEVVADLTNEPLSLDIAPDGRIFWAERNGTLNVLTPQGLRLVAGILPVSGNACVQCPAESPNRTFGLPTGQGSVGLGGLEEGGLHGILLDDDFVDNGIIYTYRSVPGTREVDEQGRAFGEFHFSRFVIDHATNQIDLDSEEILLRVPAEWDNCCHYGGDLDYLPDGTITITTGDDVPASSSEGYGPRDTRNHWLNAELSSANPADLRGKILRVTEDGAVPGIGNDHTPNPFIGMEGYIPDTLATDEAWVPFDPYIYSLGWKQPWRAVVHPSGTMYVSDVGPDAGVDDPERGPRGFEEVNRVPAGGGTHHGWPRCAADNIPYVDVDWRTGTVGAPLDCSETAIIARPAGSDDPDTYLRGMTGAPFYYPSGASTQWPIVGSGGKTSEPVAFYPADHEGPYALPDRFANRLFLLEWSRNFILTIPADPVTGELDLRNDAMERIQPAQLSVNPDAASPNGVVSAMQGRLMSPSDGVVGPDGAFYFLEYGAFYYAGVNGRLSRLRATTPTGPVPTADYGIPAAALPGAPALTTGLAGVLPVAQPAALALLGLVLLAWTRRRSRQVA